MHSDTYKCIRVPSEEFGRFRKIFEISSFVYRFLKFLCVFARLEKTTFGEDYMKMRLGADHHANFSPSSQARNRTDGWTDGRTDHGRTDRRTDGRIDGRTDGRRTDKRTDGRARGPTPHTSRNVPRARFPRHRARPLVPRNASGNAFGTRWRFQNLRSAAAGPVILFRRARAHPLRRENPYLRTKSDAAPNENPYLTAVGLRPADPTSRRRPLTH